MKIALSVLLLLVVSPVLAVQYHVEIQGEISGSHGSFGSSTYFTFYPKIDVLEDGASTDAFVTLSSPSPTRHFEGYVNHPETSTAKSTVHFTTNDVVNNANGTWWVRIEDEAVYEWEVDISFSLPFTELPHFISTTLVNGHPAGTLSWSLQGGSSAYPGPGSGLKASLGDVGFTASTSADLPHDATAWTPNFDYSIAQEFFASIRTRNEAQDSSALNILEVRSVTPGAPELSFATPSVRYTAERSARLGPPVPEPSSVSIGIVAFTASALFGRRRHSSDRLRRDL